MKKPPEGLCSDRAQSFSVEGVDFTWTPGEGPSLFGVDSILFWLKPSLLSVLQPLFDELGEELYSHLIAFEASKGTFEDYQVAIAGGIEFGKGLANWSHVVALCGWGKISIESLDWERKRARVSISNPWELKLFKNQNPKNQIPFLRGKISGIFSHAFGTNCLAKISAEENDQDQLILEVQPSLETLEQALLDAKKSSMNYTETDLRAINNSLRRNQRRLLDMIETVGEFIWECNFTLQLTYTTDTARAILGWTDSDLVGVSWVKIIHEKSRIAFADMLSRSASHPNFVEGEFLVSDEGGQERWILIRAKRLFDFSQSHVGYVGSARDISKEKKLAKELVTQREASQYAAKMATLGEMAGGIAHEINTPLAVIGLQTEFFLEKFMAGSLTKEESESSGKIILATIDRIAKIIRGLRSFSRDATQDPKVKASLSDLFADTLLLCKNRIANAGVKLQFHEAPEGANIYCRPIQISQVLLNLLNNSFDAVSDLKEQWIEISSRINGNLIAIEVKDSGSGISEEVREKIMQPFFTTKPVGEGTGLGLSISKGIVEDHGGRIYIDTASPNTCFVVELPISKY